MKNVFAIFLFLSFTLTGCVSVKLDTGIVSQKSTQVSLVAPGKAFHQVKNPHVDQSWQNKKNRNIISYLSDCENPTDPSLENIFKGIISEIETPEVIESYRVDYNARQALHSVVQGKIDGIDTRFELMIFKKNNCTYILTYAASAPTFAENQRDFAQFVKGFRVP